VQEQTGKVQDAEALRTEHRRPVLLPALVHASPMNGQVIRRVRLLNRLDAAPASKLVLVAAPAGYGKTTLLATAGPAPNAGAGQAPSDPDPGQNTNYHEGINS
jgi:hypothetical protein